MVQGMGKFLLRSKVHSCSSASLSLQRSVSSLDLIFRTLLGWGSICLSVGCCITPPVPSSWWVWGPKGIISDPMKGHLDVTCINLSCALMKIRLRGLLLNPYDFFYIDGEQCSMESTCFGERGLHWRQAWCSSSETLCRLDLAGYSFSIYSKTPLRCRSPSGATSALDLLLKRTFLVRSLEGAFCQGQVRNSGACSWAVPSVCLCKCDQWCGSVFWCELKWCGGLKMQQEGKFEFVCFGVFCCFGFLLIYWLKTECP